ncbi:MAG: phytanoyl-CoA dioxygenase family protein [Lentisphaeria bacterium]|nr:phytanoyl-CoA dioxygenase family protein [Lentisphaeria bacterium]NQZ68338.1 phytanoyl-CoA dioxygenase family protein [Lentisphaeria bacterium]
MTLISDEDWASYERTGYLKLGKILDEHNLKGLQDRIDEIMLGKAALNYNKMLMQLDSTSGEYGDLDDQTKGHKGSSLNYRKIQDLELDDKFLEFMSYPIFEEICTHVYGEGINIACFRAMFFNKPSMKGTKLPWHQDRWNNLDKDPLVTIWAALDPATIENGCVEIIPGSHKRLINPEHPSGFLTDEQAAELCTDEDRVYLELEAGEVMLLHNWLLHSSDTNKSADSRRAFSVCYMDHDTMEKGEAISYPVIFGENAISLQS